MQEFLPVIMDARGSRPLGPLLARSVAQGVAELVLLMMLSGSISSALRISLYR
jgi:hypothetical protein